VTAGGSRVPWPELGLLAGFGALTLALATGQLVDVDLAVRHWCDAHQVRPVHVAARGLIVLGSGNVVAPVVLALAAVVAVRTRSVRPVVPVVVAVVAGNLLLVPLKMFFDRASPHSPAPDPVLLFHYPPGWSYPSGHAANSVYLYAVLVLALDGLRGPVRPGIRRAIRVVPPVVVAVTFTYLGYHWLTDILAGLLLGLFLDRLLGRLPERTRTATPAPAGATSRPG
jgi:membrane-associated phospholipid phosphatase